MSAEATAAVARAIYDAETRLRTYVATTQARATYRYHLGGRTEGGAWVSGQDGTVHYYFTQAIVIDPKRDVYFKVTVTFGHDAYRVTHTVVDSLEIPEGYDEVELIAEKRTSAPTEPALAAALTAAIDEICALNDFLARLDPPLPPKTKSAAA